MLNPYEKSENHNFACLRSIFLPTEDIVAVLFLAAISSSKPPTRIRSHRRTSHHRRNAISLRIYCVSRYGRWCKISDEVRVANDALILARSCAFSPPSTSRDVNLHGAFNATRDTADFQVPSYYDVTYRSLE